MSRQRVPIVIPESPPLSYKRAQQYIYDCDKKESDENNGRPVELSAREKAKIEVDECIESLTKVYNTLGDSLDDRQLEKKIVDNIRELKIKFHERWH